MKRTLLAPYVAKGLMRLLGIGAVAALVTQGLYIYKFSVQTGDWFVLSPSKQDWGTFGDFVGGTLNPIFSFLAFVGVVLTVVLQARQLDEVKAQANLEEMQRVASTIANRVDDLLSQHVPEQSGPDLRVLARTTLFELISAGGTYRLHELAGTYPDDWMKYVDTGASADRYDAFTKDVSVALRLQLESLSWMLLRYREEGGSGTVLDFYAYRYAAVSCWLDAMGLLEDHGQVQAFFKPNDLRPNLTPRSTTDPA